MNKNNMSNKSSSSSIQLPSDSLSDNHASAPSEYEHQDHEDKKATTSLFDIPLDSVIRGEQVGSVIESRHKDYPPYSLVVCWGGWRTLTILNPDHSHVTKVPILGQLPISMCLGPLGYPGLLAYVALQLCCHVKVGDVVVVNSAAGPVANVVGQLAKDKGAIVIAFCSSYEHSVWLRNVRFDYIYIDTHIKPSSALEWVAPSGVDYYFDSVGADFTHGILPHLKQHTTVCLFGYSNANLTPTGPDLDPYHMIWMKGCHFCTDSVFKYKDAFENIQARLITLISEGKLKYKENIVRGFKNLPSTLISLLQSPVVGRAVVAASDTSLQAVVLEY